MSNGINSNDPNRLNQTQLNQHRKSKQEQPQQAEEQPVTASQDARPTVDPDKMMAMLAQAGSMNAANIENAQLNRSIDQSLDSFFNMITPEAHEALFQQFDEMIRNEFGASNPQLAQDALDNLIIGVPTFQT